MKKKLLYLLTFIAVCVTVIAFHDNTPKTIYSHYYELGMKENSKPSYRMFYLIETYSDSFNVPKYVAYNVAYRETRIKTGVSPVEHIIQVNQSRIIMLSFVKKI